MLHRLREAAALNLRCRDIFESGLPRTYPTTRRLALCPCLFLGRGGRITPSDLINMVSDWSVCVLRRVAYRILPLHPGGAWGG